MELLKQKEGGNRMNHYEAINDVLVNLFNEILDLEERALITGEYKNISVNDMHIINAVGIREQKNMSTVARELNVTVGTLTIAVNNLVVLAKCYICFIKTGVKSQYLQFFENICIHKR